MTPHPMIAVINDEAPIREALTEALQHHGIFAIPYENGERLLRDVRLLDFRVVVTDWRNRPLSGRELWDALVDRSYTGRVVFVSSRGDEIAAIFAGADPAPADIIDLPAPMPKVAARIVSQLSR